MFFENDLVATTTSADVKLATLLGRIDRFVERTGLAPEVTEVEPFVPIWPKFFSLPVPDSIDLNSEGIETVIWATGFRRSYPWLRVPVLDDRGEIRHHNGLTEEPGLYVLGLQFQHRRKSAFIDGVGADAECLARHLSRREPMPSAAVA